MERLSHTGIEPTQRKHWRQPKTSHDLIRKQLAILATARRSVMDEAGFLTYSAGLEGFLILDLTSAIGQLCLQDAPTGKTSMPSLGAMVTACQEAAQRRHEAEAVAKQMEESEYRLNHPDRFISTGQVVIDMNMMRDAVEVAFGRDWRTHPLMLERDGRGVDPTKHRFGLADMYDLAMRP